jgi:hypothetical protein
MQTEASWSLLGAVASIIGTRAYTVYSSATLGRQKVLDQITDRLYDQTMDAQVEFLTSLSKPFKDALCNICSLLGYRGWLMLSTSKVLQWVAACFASNKQKCMCCVWREDDRCCSGHASVLFTQEPGQVGSAVQDGVIYYLLDQMADQHVKEQMLAYFTLLNHGNAL